jgi:hypothetical protein
VCRSLRLVGPIRTSIPTAEAYPTAKRQWGRPETKRPLSICLAPDLGSNQGPTETLLQRRAVYDNGYSTRLALP